jgi:hypothetical protein
MTTILPPKRRGSAWRRRALALALALTVLSGQVAAATRAPAVKLTPTSVSRGEWLRSIAIVLVIAVGGGYVWYFGLFPRLLRAKNPRSPMEAWRLASYATWLTICAAAWFLKDPLTKSVFRPLLTVYFRQTLIDYFMEFFLLPVLALVGLLVIWNFRRSATARA